MGTGPTQGEPKHPKKRKRKEKEAEVDLAPGEPVVHELPATGTPWVQVHTTLRAGKYKGRRAVVLGLAKKKYRVQVEGLDYQLEFYASFVGLPPPPEGYFSLSPEDAQGMTPQQQQQQQEQEHALMQAGQACGEGQPGALMGGTMPGTAMVRGLSMTSVGSYRSGGNSNGNAAGSSGTAEGGAFRAQHAHWVGESLPIQRGKYEGRLARIIGLTTAKLQVSVPGVDHQLEYYPSMFIGPQPKTTTAE